MSACLTVRGRTFAIRLPALDVREDLVITHGSLQRRHNSPIPMRRLSAAMVALCCPEVGHDIKVSVSARDDLLAFGGEVYNALRDRQWTPEEIRGAGEDILPELVEQTFPRKSEVVKAQGNSDGGAAS